MTGFSFMAIGAVVHFHAQAVFGLAQPRYVVTPDVPAVAGQAIFLIGPAMVGLSHVAVAGPTFHVRPLDMGGM